MRIDPRRALRSDRLALGADRQVDGEARALADLAVDLNRTTGLVNEAVDLAQTEAGALADFLGREDRIEYLRQEVGRNARARVAEPDRGEGAVEVASLRVDRRHHFRQR